MVDKFLLVGSGGREHAIADAIYRSGAELYAVMSRKNPGIASLCTDHKIGNEIDPGAISEYAVKNDIDSAVIGPEAPLEAGVVDALEKVGISCASPTKAAARIETDKSWARNFMTRHNITGLPEYRVFTKGSNADDYIEELKNVAVKPTGLTGGKGVKLTGSDFNIDGAKTYAGVCLKKGDIVIEEQLFGEEFTLQAFTDGETLAFSPAVQDHKRAGEGDTGGNTGGMGSYTASKDILPFMMQNDYDEACGIMNAAISGLKREGTPYKGVLYGQFMLTADGIKVIEFNARFGDPEAMNVLPILKTPLSNIYKAIVGGTLSDINVEFQKKATVCKYAVPMGYPENPVKDSPILIGDITDALLFYGSVDERNGTIYTTSSRAVATVGIADTIYAAERKAEAAILQIKGRLEHRQDIGTQSLIQRRVEHMGQLGRHVT